MKKIFMLMIFSCLLVGCSTTYKSAQEIGKGVSVEIQTNDAVTIKHLQIEKYVDGHFITSENVINANNSPFENGEIINFDLPVQANEKAEYIVKYSGNLDGTNDKATEKIAVNPTDSWVNLVLNEQLQLEIE